MWVNTVYDGRVASPPFMYTCPRRTCQGCDTANTTPVIRLTPPQPASSPPLCSIDWMAFFTCNYIDTLNACKCGGRWWPVAPWHGHPLTYNWPEWWMDGPGAVPTDVSQCWSTSQKLGDHNNEMDKALCWAFYGRWIVSHIAGTHNGAT